MTDTNRQTQDSNKTAALRAEAEKLAASLPPLLVAAERLASVVGLGVHGRRKAGIGETFWQFRHYSQGDSTSAIDWRQSGKSQHVFIREREWEAQEAVWFWRDGSPGMRFASARNLPAKIDRANLLSLALASLLVRGGERIALLGGESGAMSGRIALTSVAHGLLGRAPSPEALPPDAPLSRSAQLIWLSDFLLPLPDIESALRRLAGRGFTGHLVHIIDPAEQDFPYDGRVRFEWDATSESELFGRAERVGMEYRRRFAAQGAAVRDLARKLGWSYLAHRTDCRPEVPLIALYADIGGPHALKSGTQAPMQ